MTIKRGLIAVWLVVSLSVVLAGTADAHALLVRSNPAANAELLQSPATIELWFSEPLEPGFSSARLLAAAGQEVPIGAALFDSADPNHMTLPLGQLTPGIYTVAWKTLSRVDGHEWYGSFPFTVLNPDGSRPSGTAANLALEARSELPTPLQAAARWFILMGSILFLGAPLFFKAIVLTGDRAQTDEQAALEAQARQLVLKLIGLAVLAIVLGDWLQIALQASRLESITLLPRLIYGTRIGALALSRQALVVGGWLITLALTQPRPASGHQRWISGVSAIYEGFLLLLVIMSGLQGESVIATFTLVIMAAAGGLAWRKRGTAGVTTGQPWNILLLLGAVALLSFSIGSHAGAVPGSAWAVLGDYIHLLAASAWLGGLLLLPLMVWQVRRSPTVDRRPLWAMVRRYSYLASFAVFVLIVTGLFNGLVHIPTLSSLIDTTYGRVLLIKVLILVGALGIAFLNNRLVHHKAHRLHATELRRFNRQINLEAVVSFVLMMSVAVLVQTQPPGAIAPASASEPDLPFNDIAQADDLSMHVQVTPNQAGLNRFWVHLYHPDGSSFGEVQLVRLLFNYRDAELGRSEADLIPLGQDTFALEGAYLNQAGAWDLSIYVRRRGMDDALTNLRLSVPAATSAATGADPLQNPIPAIPIDGLLAGVMIVLGLVPFLWYRLFRRTLPDLALILMLIGGVFIVVGVVAGTSAASILAARLNTEADTLVLTNPIAPTADSIQQGSLLYQQHCAVCHGPTGAGDGPQAAKLNPKPANLRVHLAPGLHSDAQVFRWITNGLASTAMPAFGDTLTEQQRWHVINFIRTFAARK